MKGKEKTAGIAWVLAVSKHTIAHYQGYHVKHIPSASLHNLEAEFGGPARTAGTSSGVQAHVLMS
jgi:hypothetical protein